MDAATPFSALTPDAVLDALASVGLPGDGRILALNSFENRVYQVHLEQGEPVVAKFYRPGRWGEAQIREEHVFARELAEAEVPMVAPRVLVGDTLHRHGPFWFSVSPRRGGRRMEAGDFDALEWTGRLLARVHQVGSQAAFVHRPALSLERLVIEPREWLLAHGQIPAEVESAWRRVTDDAIILIAARGELATTEDPSGTSIRQLRVHGDCHLGNILWTPDGGPHFVDLDDCTTAPAVQDLWMLLSGERAEQRAQLAALLDGYEQLRDFDRRELSLIEPLRTLRLIHYSAWLARRWRDPIFAQAFPWFGSRDYWQEQVDTLTDQVEAMSEAPSPD